MRMRHLEELLDLSTEVGLLSICPVPQPAPTCRLWPDWHCTDLPGTCCITPFMHGFFAERAVHCPQAKALQDNCSALTKELNILKLKYGQAEEENRRISEELRIKKEKVRCPLHCLQERKVHT